MEGDRVFLSADDRAVVRKAIAQLERVRGLPLTLPEHTKFDEVAAALRDIVARAETKWMSTEDVADVLDVSEAWVRVLAKRGAFGDLSAHIEGTEWRIPRAGVEAYLAGRAARPTRGTARKKTSANSRTP